MTQLSLKQVSLAYGAHALFDHIDLIVEQGQRIGIMGRNGAGKSTLMKVIAGLIKPDDGERTLSHACRLAYLPQEVPYGSDKSQTVYDVVSEGGGETGAKLKRLQELSQQLADHPEQESALMKQMTTLQDEIDHANGWALQQNIETQLSRFNLDGQLPFSSLSGGLKRRVLLAKALINQPNLLLLDEPTNHLDIDAIEFLESFLQSYSGTTMIISHDRRFLANTTDRIIEIDRGAIFNYAAGFDRFVDLKEARLDAEAKQQALFDKKLAEEEVWIRKGIKARRTRNQGRVRALEALRAEKRTQISPQGQVKMSVNSQERSGKQVIVTKEVSYTFPGQSQATINPLSTVILRGDKVAVIGPNGVGKTTLLKLLLEKIAPSSGSVKGGTQCQVAYFDQLRDTLDPDRTVLDNVGEGSSQITVNGKEKHVVGYLQEFLFSPDKIHSPVKVLSGGERNRLLLAKLFTQPANLLVLDEPTNDLDIETLELLEELLMDYQGTLLLVSHDREFIDKVATNSLVFEAPGKVVSYVGGYTDWIQQRPAELNDAPNSALSSGKAVSGKVGSKTSSPGKSGSEQTGSGKKASTQPKEPSTKEKPRKLSYKDQRELEQLPAEIERVESALEAVQAQLAEPQFYQSASPEEVSTATQNLEKLEAELEHLYERWEQLDG